jgi:hypothetical protein
MAESSAAKGQSSPQRNRVGGVRRHRRDAGKQQGRKRNKASAPGDGIQHAPEQGGKKQQKSIVWIQGGRAQA